MDVSQLEAIINKAWENRETISLETKGEVRIAVEKALDGFKDGKFDVIIATDLAARGIDISNVSHVINYQVPENAEDYVHRIGRTGRANREGDAFTLLSADELDHAKAVESYIDQKIEKRKLDNFNYQYTTLLDEDAPTPEKLAKIFRSKKRGGSRRRRR